MIIRSEHPGDCRAIHQVTTLAFQSAPHASHAEARIVDALREADALPLSLVAVQQDRVVGHVAFSPVTIDGRSGGWFGLGPVSVLPDDQRRGIGSALIEEGLQRLRSGGARGCVVLGDPAYYARFGFLGEPGLSYGDVPPEYFQCLAFGGDRPKGQVAYHPAFDVR